MASNKADAREQLFDPRRPLAAELETSVEDGFTLATAGDCIVSRPHAQLLGQDPELARVVKMLQSASTAFGNLGTSPAGEPQELPAELDLFGATFRLGERPDVTYEVNEIDRAEILREVRQGKQLSDFLLLALHAHEEGLGRDEPGDFVPDLAHVAIEAGADAVVVSGVHRLRPIEVYHSACPRPGPQKWLSRRGSG